MEQNLCWIVRHGQNGKGELLHVSYLVDKTEGRILALISHPVADELDYRCRLWLDEVVDNNSDRMYTSLEPARAYCEGIAHLYCEMQRNYCEGIAHLYCEMQRKALAGSLMPV